MVKLNARRWFVLSREDMDGIAARARRTGRWSVDGGFAHGGSLQAAFAPPGTLSEAARIREELARTGQALPCRADAQACWRALDPAPTHYRYQETSWGWEIALTSSVAEPAFCRGEWVILFESSNSWIPIPLASGTLPLALQAFAALSGRLAFDALPAEGKQLLLQMAATGLLCDSEAPDWKTEGWLPPNSLLWMGHASLLLRGAQATVWIDPLAHPDSAVDLDAVSRTVDLVLLSHHHWDHAHLPTLARLSRVTPVAVPRVRAPSVGNPSLAMWLKGLGFTAVWELDPWEELRMDGITITAAPFFGEHFGEASRFDGITPLVRMDGFSFYCTVDAGAGAMGEMTEVIEEVARRGPIDLLFLGCTGQEHHPLYAPSGLRAYSDRLRTRPDLKRYHITPREAVPWLECLQPRWVVPYASFQFRGALATVRIRELGSARGQPPPVSFPGSAQASWCAEMESAAQAAGVGLAWLGPGTSLE